MKKLTRIIHEFNFDQNLAKLPVLSSTLGVLVNHIKHI